MSLGSKSVSVKKTQGGNYVPAPEKEMDPRVKSALCVGGAIVIAGLARAAVRGISNLFRGF